MSVYRVMMYSGFQRTLTADRVVVNGDNICFERSRNGSWVAALQLPTQLVTRVPAGGPAGRHGDVERRGSGAQHLLIARAGRRAVIALQPAVRVGSAPACDGTPLRRVLVRRRRRHRTAHLAFPLAGRAVAVGAAPPPASTGAGQGPYACAPLQPGSWTTGVFAEEFQDPFRETPPVREGRPWVAAVPAWGR